LNDLRRLGPAAQQTPLQLLGRRRHQENQHRIVSAPAANLPRALHVDAQHHIAPRVQRALHRPPRRAIQRLVHPGPLEQPTPRPQLFELLHRDEIILLAVLLGSAPAARGHRY
jgi:hypothetical protein